MGEAVDTAAAKVDAAVDSTKAKMVNLLKRSWKMDAAGKKWKKLLKNNLQKNRLSIGSLFFYL
jgi:hypothetical protein